MPRRLNVTDCWAHGLVTMTQKLPLPGKPGLEATCSGSSGNDRMGSAWPVHRPRGSASLGRGFQNLFTLPGCLLIPTEITS